MMHAALLAAALAAAPPPLAVDPGPLPVGFTVVRTIDAARRLNEKDPWPVEIGLWYPAASGGEPMRYRDYVALDGDVEEYRKFLRGNGVMTEAGIDAWLDAPLLAGRGARARAGRFPVVLIAGGMGGALADQAVLAEHLAGRGYVVATTPSPLRLGVRMEGDDDVLPMAQAQQRDLEIALAAARRQPNADAKKLALVGYSFGARPQLLMAARHPEAQALVSLDGGIGARAAKGWVEGAALDRGAVRLPLLHVWQDDDDAVTPDFALIESLEWAPRTLVRVLGLRHLDLPAWGVARARIAALAAPDAEALGARVRACYTLTSAFLDAHLERDHTAWSRAVGNAPRALLTVKELPGRTR